MKESGRLSILDLINGRDITCVCGSSKQVNHSSHLIASIRELGINLSAGKEFVSVNIIITSGLRDPVYTLGCISSGSRNQSNTSVPIIGLYI
jgi:hypothetical protein